MAQCVVAGGHASVGTLPDRFSRLECVHPDVAWNHTLTVRGPSTLLMRAGA